MFLVDFSVLVSGDGHTRVDPGPVPTQFSEQPDQTGPYTSYLPVSADRESCSVVRLGCDELSESNHDKTMARPVC